MSDNHREQTLAFWLSSSERAAVDLLAGEFDDFLASGSADRAPAAVVEHEQSVQAAENDESVFEEESALPRAARITATTLIDTPAAADEYIVETDLSEAIHAATGADAVTALFGSRASTPGSTFSSGVFIVDSGDVSTPDVPDPVLATGGQLGQTAASAPQPEENGSGDATVAVAASGDQQIDGLLSGVRWSDGFITYSDPDSVADYQVTHPEPFNNFAQMTAQQMIAVHFGLNAAIYTQPIGASGFGVEGFTNLIIDYAGTGTGAGTIRVANTSDPGTAYAYYPNNDVYGGDAFFGPSGDFPTAGNYDWHTVLHELGHSLGLAHGHTGGGYGALPGNVDSQEYSIMTYRTYIGQPISGYSYETWGAPQTFMMLDIAALQYMYGADYTTNSGNTTYTWSPTTGETIVNGNIAIDPGGNRIFATIWDGGGTDTYDLSNYTTNLVIDLAPGGHSVFSSTQLAYLGGGPNGGYARGNIFNALLFAANTASLIENAYGGSGHDSISGNQAANFLKGGGGNDSLYGLAGNDLLSGDAGDDYLDDSSGGDSVFGGSGNDWVHMGDASINGDSYDGGSGVDTFDAAHFVWAVDVTIDLTAGVWSYSAGSEAVTGFENIRGSSNSAGTTETLRGNGSNNIIYGNGGVDVIYGEAGNDYLDGGAAADTINGGGGVDTMYGGSGIDTLNGGDGNDLLYGGFSTDTITGGAGNDVIYVLDGEFGDDVDGGAGADSYSFANFANYYVVINFSGSFSQVYTSAGVAFGPVNTVTGIENVVGGALGDTISGNLLVNTMTGNAGNDILNGLAGADTLYGNLGDDTLVGHLDGDLLHGGAGNDTANYALSNAAISINLTAGTAAGGHAAGDTLVQIENIVGSNFNDTLIGDGLANVLTGGAGTDSLSGQGGADTLLGGAGNDVLTGWTGAEVLNGGAGINTANYGGSTAGVIIDLTAGTGVGGHAAGDSLILIQNVVGSGFNDTLRGTAAANNLNGGGGNDILYGFAGNDVLLGGAGNDTFFGDAGADTINGGAGIDAAYYNTSNAAVNINLGAGTAAGGHATGDTLLLIENLIGSAFNDTLIGTGGANALFGGAGNDILNGGAGNDVLDGQAGSDSLLGSTGSDNFYYRSGYQDDLVAGFDDNLDTIRLDDNLWGGGLTVAQVLATFASQTSASIVDFDFGAGNTLRVSQGGITVAALQDDILII